MHDNPRIEELKSTIDYAITHDVKNYRIEMSYAEFVKMKRYLASKPEGDGYCITEGATRSVSVEKPYYITKR